MKYKIGYRFKQGRGWIHPGRICEVVGIGNYNGVKIRMKGDGYDYTNDVSEGSIDKCERVNPITEYFL